MLVFLEKELKIENEHYFPNTYQKLKKNLQAGVFYGKVSSFVPEREYVKLKQNRVRLIARKEKK